MNKFTYIWFIFLASCIITAIISHCLTRTYDLRWEPAVFACGFLYGERAIIIDNQMTVKIPEAIDACPRFKELARQSGFTVSFPDTPVQEDQ